MSNSLASIVVSDHVPEIPNNDLQDYMVPDNSPAHISNDLPRYIGTPITYYMICSTPRTGSSLLGKILESSGLFGASTEFLHLKRHFPIFARRFNIVNQNGEVQLKTYFENLFSCRTSPNGVFGIKCHFDQFEPISKFHEWESYLPNLKFIYIERENLLSQAISLTIAIQTGSFSSRVKPIRRPQYNRSQIENNLAYIVALNAKWEMFFRTNGIFPFRLTYESFIEQPKKLSEGIFEYVGINSNEFPFSLTFSDRKQQRGSTNKEWMDNYMAGL